MKVLILSGGNSPEREISLRSGRAIADALKAKGYGVENYDPIKGYEGLADFAGKVDCVFPILHGKGGEDGEVQEWLEQLNFKYLGSGPQASKLCFDKALFKEELNKLDILTPKWEVVDSNTVKNSVLINKPYVLKPIDGGSTIDAYIIRDPAKQSYQPDVFGRYSSMLLEELISGTEITVSVLGKKALPVIEIIPPEGREFDYENKYNGATRELCPPKNVGQSEQEQAQRLSEEIHSKLGARHLSRTDIMIDKELRLWILELNTMPGLTSQSLFPKSAEVAGLSMEDLVQRFIELVLGL